MRQYILIFEDGEFIMRDYITPEDGISVNLAILSVIDTHTGKYLYEYDEENDTAEWFDIPDKL